MCSRSAICSWTARGSPFRLLVADVPSPVAGIGGLRPGPELARHARLERRLGDHARVLAAALPPAPGRRASGRGSGPRRGYGHRDHPAPSAAPLERGSAATAPAAESAAEEHEAGQEEERDEDPQAAGHTDDQVNGDDRQDDRDDRDHAQAAEQAEAGAAARAGAGPDRPAGRA